MKKNILFVIILIILICSIAGYFLWNKPHIDVKSASAIETNANTLLGVFIDDSVGAKATYLNKVVNVSGTIKKISYNQEHHQIVLLKTSVSDASINCTMETDKEGLNIGDRVHIKGICAGYIGGDFDMGLLGDVFLIRCYAA
ncbi:MAG: hypothetical protein ABI691_08315 [Ginsengibacter sp.]